MINGFYLFQRNPVKQGEEVGLVDIVCVNKSDQILPLLPASQGINNENVLLAPLVKCLHQVTADKAGAPGDNVFNPHGPSFKCLLGTTGTAEHRLIFMLN